MSKTEENLKTAFAGESQARNKYIFYAKVARKEGYHYIAKIFEENAENEEQHAKDEFRLLGGIGSTVENLKVSIEGENYETTSMYPEFARIAREEGNKQAAILFEQIAKIEAQHRNRFKRLLEMVENDTVYKREKPIKWICIKCGYVHEGKEPPEICPCCKHPKEFYEPETV